MKATIITDNAKKGGSYLAELLLENDCWVFGLARWSTTIISIETSISKERLCFVRGSAKSIVID